MQSICRHPVKTARLWLIEIYGGTLNEVINCISYDGGDDRPHRRTIQLYTFEILMSEKDVLPGDYARAW